ncbi:hypothetical protein ATANTOWER_008753, partial [Ataeniobius toweri]|nr:hypothetical protein [Ataeniobius toweri]
SYQGTETCKLLQRVKSHPCGPENLLECGSTGVLPGKQDIAHSCPVAVDAQESERQGDLRDQRAVSLNQEVDEEQAEHRQHGQYHLVFRAEK